MKIFFNNILSGNKEEFSPLHEGKVLMYNCGPTVYFFPTIGNMRSYLLADILRRTFEYSGLEVKQVINITDVGHLVGDGDDGEDKVETTAKKEGKTAEQIARFYEEAFYKDLKDLNIETEGTEFPRASEHIDEQKKLIEILEEKGFAYPTSDGMYFDTSRLPDYGKLGNINIEGLREGARVEANYEKTSAKDFALWKFSQNKEEKRLQEWQSPWGVGFPGWHIECSAMSRKYLGQPFDIHTGGIDHIPVHHNNEIAQSEAAYGVPLAKFWVHNEFLKVDNQKMSKSLNNIFTLADLKSHGIHPLSFRYWLLTSHYRTPANFTWEAVQGAQNALESIVSSYSELKDTSENDREVLERFEEAIADDLNTPIAISLLQTAKSKFVIDKMDQVFGLNIKNLSEKMFDIPEEILSVKSERDRARGVKDFAKSDQLRTKIESGGYVLEDKDSGSTIRKNLAGIV